MTEGEIICIQFIACEQLVVVDKFQFGQRNIT